MKNFRLQLVVLLVLLGSRTGFAQETDSLRTDSVVVIPPQMQFLPDSLLHLYVVEDTVKYTYGMIMSDLGYFLENYPDYVHAEKSGFSEFGNEMKMVRIGRENPKPDAIFIVGNIHAREDFSSKLVMKFLNIYLLSITGKSSLYPDAAKYLDSVDIYVMPVANPDGLMIAQEDFKTIRDSFGLYRDSIRVIENFTVWKANGKGIDLNRTFDDGNFEVKKTTGFPSSENYKGEFPAQPVETQFIQQFIAAKKPLITASFHTKGNILYWADGKTHAFFNDVDTKINRDVAAASGFETAVVSRNPAEYGCGLENYVRARFGLIGTCVELSPGSRYRSQHADNLFNELVWLNAWNIPYIYIRDAALYKNEIRAVSQRMSPEQ